MIYLKLFINFFKIGLFSFGGGYAMIPLISDIISKNEWMTDKAFTQIIGIAEMTPGPIAVNSATFVGYKVAGIAGSFFATLGVATPSLMLILLISKVFFKYSDHQITKSIFRGIRPIVAGLIISSAIFISKSALFDPHNPGSFNYATLIIVFMLLILIRRKKCTLSYL